jgi:hypothetical protein
MWSRQWSIDDILQWRHVEKIHLEKRGKKRDSPQKAYLVSCSPSLSEVGKEGLFLFMAAALDRVLPSDDPLDRSDFDPVAFINQHFPTERYFGTCNRSQWTLILSQTFVSFTKT